MAIVGIVALLPVLVVVFVLQRHIVRGLTPGAADRRSAARRLSLPVAHGPGREFGTFMVNGRIE